MRNNSGEVLRRVAQGESILVTNNGVPAAVMTPVTASDRARLRASGRLHTGTGLDLASLPTPKFAPKLTDELLAEDRGE